MLNAEPYEPGDIRQWEYDDQKTAGVISLAWQGNQIAAGVLAELVSYFRRAGPMLPPNLFRYCDDLASGRRPDAPAEQIGMTLQRDLDITILVQLIMRVTGLKESARPAARRRPTPSACWIAQRALANHKIYLSYSAIRAAVRDYKHLGTDLVPDPMDYELVHVDGSVIVNLRDTFRKADEHFANQNERQDFPQASAVLSDVGNE